MDFPIQIDRIRMRLSIIYFKGVTGRNFQVFMNRAYPGSEFVVANTLAKLKKVEPNKTNFSLGFSQKVSTSCFVFNSLTTMSTDNLYKQFGPRSGPTKCRA